MMRRFTVALAAMIGLTATAWSDTVELSGGGHVAGTAQRVADKKLVVVQVDDEIRVAIPESRVKRVVTDEDLAEYRHNVEKAGSDAELNYELGRWCKGKLLIAQYRYHMQRAIALDPEHERARASLHYVKEDGEWIQYADLQRRRGLISVGGRWKLPEAVAIENAQEAANVEAKKWEKEVARLAKIASNPRSGKAGEAIESLKAINDPLAASAVANQLENSRGKNTPLRRLWVTLLGRFRNGVSVEALVKTGVEDRDDVIREAAIEELQKYGSSSAVATYLQMLKSNINDDVRRAARALTFFPDPELALTYVDALVTQHKKVGPVGPGMQAGFGDNGVGGLAMGGKQKVVITEKQNPHVLTLLKMVEPGADFGYDETAWRQHFADKLTSYSGDLRRDP